MPSAISNLSRRSMKVWRRNLEVFMKTWIMNLIPPILEPVLYVLAFGFGLGYFVGNIQYEGHPIRYLSFMAPGVVAVAIMFWAFFENTYSSFVRMYYQKTFDAMIATPLLVEDVILGEILWGATKATMAAAIMLAVLTSFGLVQYPSGLWVFPLAAVGGFIFACLGLVTTALVPSIDSFNLPIFLLVYPMFMFSGTFFPLDILPVWAKDVALALPLTHVAILVRGAFIGILRDGWGWSVVYLCVLSPVVFHLSLVLMKRRLVK